MKNTESLIGAFVIGAVAGAVIGVLTAPAKGSETRSKLKSQAGDLADFVMKKFGKGSLKDFYENVHSASNPAKG